MHGARGLQGRALFTHVYICEHVCEHAYMFTLLYTGATGRPLNRCAGCPWLQCMAACKAWRRPSRPLDASGDGSTRWNHSPSRQNQQPEPFSPITGEERKGIAWAAALLVK